MNLVVHQHGRCFLFSFSTKKAVLRIQAVLYWKTALSVLLFASYTLKILRFELASWARLSTTPRYLATYTTWDDGFGVPRVHTAWICETTVCYCHQGSTCITTGYVFYRALVTVASYAYTITMIIKLFTTRDSHMLSVGDDYCVRTFPCQWRAHSKYGYRYRTNKLSSDPLTVR